MKNTLILAALLTSGSAFAAPAAAPATSSQPSRNLTAATNFKLGVTALRDVVALAGACDAKYSAIARSAVGGIISKSNLKQTAAERQAIVNAESVKALEALAEVEPSSGCKAAAEHLVESGGAIALRAGAKEKWDEVQAQANAMFGL